MADLEKFDKDNKAPKTPKMRPDMTRRQFMMAGGAGALGLYVAGHGGLLRSSRLGSQKDPLRTVRDR